MTQAEATIKCMDARNLIRDIQLEYEMVNFQIGELSSALEKTIEVLWRMVEAEGDDTNE